jgi:transcription antitermination factor NusG
MNANIYLKILRIKGVIGFFCNGGKPAAILDEEMETIQRSLKDGREVNFCNSRENIRAYMAGNKTLQASNP